MTWDETKQTAADPDNPNANEQLTASDWNAHVREQKAGRVGEWVVYEDSGTWYAEGPDGASETSGSAPGTVLQHAADNASLYVHLRSSVSDTNDITTTVTIPSGVSFLGPGLRGTASVYGSADPVFKMEGGGFFGNIWIRKDVGVSMGSGDGVVFEGMGRGSEIRNVNVTRTNGNGIAMNGCQQMSVYGLYFAACGDPANDTGELRLDNRASDGLETNAVNFYGLHSHGDANPQGTFIQMRASNHADNDRPRNIRVNGINLENGPSSAVPIIEVCGRDNHFENVRLQGIDDASCAFQLQAPRARDMTFSDVKIIGETGGGHNGFSNADSTTASSQSGTDWAPIISGSFIQVDGEGVLLAGYNQSDQALVLDNVVFPDRSSGTTAVDVTASKDVTPAVSLSDVDAGGQLISIQGARLKVSAVSNASWDSSFGSEFGPHIVADDGSMSRLHGQTASTDGSGNADVDFTTTCQFPAGASVTAEVTTDTLGNRPYQIETSVIDSGGDGTPDTARATVYDGGTTVGSGDVTVALYVHPHT